jgi:hypothetical protein
MSQSVLDGERLALRCHGCDVSRRSNLLGDLVCPSRPKADFLLDLGLPVLASGFGAGLPGLFGSCREVLCDRLGHIPEGSSLRGQHLHGLVHRNLLQQPFGCKLAQLSAQGTAPSFPSAPGRGGGATESEKANASWYLLASHARALALWHSSDSAALTRLEMGFVVTSKALPGRSSFTHAFASINLRLCGADP